MFGKVIFSNEFNEIIWLKSVQIEIELGILNEATPPLSFDKQL